jgi:hypothetical protein
MNNDGKNIFDMFKQIRNFCVQIANLLLTIDEQIGREGLESVNNTAVAYSSSSLANPKQWIPASFFRYFINKEHKNLLIFVSILVDDDIGHDYKLSEPLITAGYFDYGKDKEVKDNWQYWYSNWLGYIGRNIKFGKTYESTPNWKEEKPWNEDKPEVYPFEAWKCFGLPLVSISNAQDVNSKIVTPLIEMLPLRKF